MFAVAKSPVTTYTDGNIHHSAVVNTAMATFAIGPAAATIISSFALIVSNFPLKAAPYGINFTVSRT